MWCRSAAGAGLNPHAGYLHLRAAAAEIFALPRRTTDPHRYSHRSVFIFLIIFNNNWRPSPPFAFCPTGVHARSAVVCSPRRARAIDIWLAAVIFFFYFSAPEEYACRPPTIVPVYALLQCAGNVRRRRYLYTFLLSALCCFTLNRRSVVVKLSSFGRITVITLLSTTFSPRTRYSP